MLRIAMLLFGLGPFEAPVQISWDGACDGAELVEERLRQELVETPVDRALVEVQALVHASKSAAGVEARVELQTPHGATARTLDAASCEELAETVALLIAIHVDPLDVEPLDGEASVPREEPVVAENPLREATQPVPAEVAEPEPEPVPESERPNPLDTKPANRRTPPYLNHLGRRCVKYGGRTRGSSLA